MKKFILGLVVILYACNCTVEEVDNYETKVLLKSVETDIMGETFNFPDSNAVITTAIRVLRSGESTGLHIHEAIPVVYMIDGEITISNENGSNKIIKKGESFIGSTNNVHEAIATSDNDAVAYVVFIGSKDLQNTINK